eukprot:CAMPEP_0201532950 /NCGR_PEP_ID=MMETSP0161_2-20130828/51724_1 /ASSEMBLY_ACC=CAM_ASM_000251 /TAXON_ID=180227 /ORGANISM="Neoparamoeba aestuarina, Strain SoJaBio B1-5/56/2" /LENGTH=146 /DNA_ID=CAMNT_0047936649 /DNA_START=59 /DNA_END=495 /DNA_ORIENTATION=+
MAYFDMKPINEDEMAAMEEQLQHEQREVTKAILITLEEKYKKDGTIENIFEYAAYLIRSPIRNDKLKGIDLLSKLKSNSKVAEEAHFFLVKGLWWDANYVDANKEVDEFVGLYPQNRRGLILKEMIYKKVEHDGYVGLAMAGVGVA